MLQGMTAHYLSHATFPLKKGSTKLAQALYMGLSAILEKAGRSDEAQGILLDCRR